MSRDVLTETTKKRAKRKIERICRLSQSEKMLRIFNSNLRLPALRRQLATLTQSQVNNDEYTEVAQYPEIVENSYKNQRAKKILRWHEKIKAISTIEEKLIEINMPRYYGYKCLMLGAQLFPYNSLPFIQYITNTELEVQEFHTSASEEESKKIENFLGLIRSEIADAVEFELDGYL